MSGFIKSHFLVVTVDVMDVSSDTQENIQHDIYKLRIDKNGLNISDTVQKMGTHFTVKQFLITFPNFRGQHEQVLCGKCLAVFAACLWELLRGFAGRKVRKFSYLSLLKRKRRPFSCCNTCDEVKDAYAGKGWQVNIEEVEQCKSDEYLKRYTEQKGEGCRVYGKVQVWHLF